MLLETSIESTNRHAAPLPVRLHREEDVPLGELLTALYARKRLIAVVTLAGAILSAAIALLLPARYSAEAVIMPPPQEDSIASAVLGQLGGVASLGERSLGLKSPSDIYVGIVKSRTVADAIIERFHLKSLYGEKTMDDTRRRLAGRSEIDAGKDTLIKIAVEDGDPKRAADLANAYVKELYRQNSHLALTESAQRRLFFEHELATEREALAGAEEALKRSQQQTGMLQVNTQVEVAIRGIAELQAEIASREIALKTLTVAATENNPEVIQLNTELNGMREQLRQLEMARNRAGNPLIPTSSIPQLGLDYVRLLRELQYHETLFELLAKQFEAAKIDEAKQAPVIQIVDQAVPADKKSWPPRALLTAAGALTALAGVCGLVLVRRRDAFGPANLNGIAGTQPVS
jgi:uncharacterized protein involved in exopolysaccharide biosynthesis